MAADVSGTGLKSLQNSVAAARRELGKLRKDVKDIKEMFLRRFDKIEEMLRIENGSYSANKTMEDETVRSDIKEDNGENMNFTKDFNVIGHVKTCFKQKNGIPRQGAVCPLSKAELKIDGVREFTNVEHALDGLEKFSHVWLIFIFHKNTNTSIKAKVRPPRLDGQKVGVFASRSPHRPTPIGLTLAKLDGIHNNTLSLSGIDLLDGTPILDIKPYIPSYDSIQGDTSQGHRELNCVKPMVSDWITKPPISSLSVSYSAQALEKLGQFYGKESCGEGNCELEMFSCVKDVQKVIEDILQSDPRSIYRRNNCPNDVYHFTVDNVNISCLFEEDLVQILDIQEI